MRRRVRALIRIALVCAAAAPASHALAAGPWLVGFETGDASELASVGAGSTVFTSGVRPGSGRFAFRQAAAPSSVVSGITPGLERLRLRFSVRLPALPLVSVPVVTLRAGGSAQWSLVLLPDGRLEVQEVASLGLTVSGATPALGVGAWRTVRLTYDATAWGSLSVWVDDLPRLQGLHQVGGGKIDAIELGAATTGVDFDDLLVDQGLAVPPLGQIERLSVEGRGSRSEFAAVVLDGGGTRREHAVWEPAPDAGSYVAHGRPTTATDLYALSTPPRGSVNAVKAMWRVMAGPGQTGGGTHDLAWRVLGSVGSESLSALPSSWTMFERTWAYPPDAGAAWSVASLEGLELGARHTGALVQETRLSWVAAMVDYNPAGAVDPGPSCASASNLAWADQSSRRRKALLVDRARLTGDLVDFPVLVVLDDADLGAFARSDGQDLRFKDPAGNDLSHELVAWDGVRALVAWVKLPLALAGEDAVLYLYYGGTVATGPLDAGTPWSDGFRAVWHLDEADSAGLFRNSASDSHHLVPKGTAYTDAGRIVGARVFDGGREELAPLVPTGLLGGWSEFALELWLYPDYPSDVALQAAGEVYFLSGDSALRLGRVRRSGLEAPGRGTVQVDTIFESFGPGYIWNEVDRQAWNHVVYTYQGADYSLFINGLEVGRVLIGTDRLASSGLLYFGGPGATMNGPIDELRLSSTGRSPAYARAAHANQADPRGFLRECLAESPRAPDAGAPDAGGSDAGAPDAGGSDAGEPDAGVPDAGTPDSGAPDAGEGGSDAGGMADGGARVARQLAVGCGCSGSGAGAPTLLALLLAGLRAGRQRSRRPPASVHPAGARGPTR